MGTEIERKFLVADDSWKKDADGGEHFRQGYLAHSDTTVVRIRLIDDARAVITIKTRGGLVRSEFEYAIPAADARELLDMCGAHQLEKRRHKIHIGPHVWEVDVFSGRNAGLVLAEIELDAPDEPFERPEWLGKEVTSDPSYGNDALARPPA